MAKIGLGVLEISSGASTSTAIEAESLRNVDALTLFVPADLPEGWRVEVSPASTGGWFSLLSSGEPVGLTPGCATTLSKVAFKRLRVAGPASTGAAVVLVVGAE